MEKHVRMKKQNFKISKNVQACVAVCGFHNLRLGAKVVTPIELRAICVVLQNLILSPNFDQKPSKSIEFQLIFRKLLQILIVCIKFQKQKNTCLVIAGKKIWDLRGALTDFVSKVITDEASNLIKNRQIKNRQIVHQNFEKTCVKTDNLTVCDKIV